MLVTPLGMKIEVRPEFEKALFSMASSVVGNVTVSRFWQSCVNCFILEIYSLNGRKVMAYILKKLKKEKI